MMAAYSRPTTLQEALHCIRSFPDASIVAGATDVFPTWTGTAAAGGPRGDRGVIDISALAELRGIEDRGDHWWIGATATWSDIVRADLPPLFDGLKAAAREIGGVQIQNRGTIGGNLCNASPAADSVPVLLTLNAEVEAVGGSTFRVPLDKFILGPRQTAVSGFDELVTGVRVPKQAGRGGFLKLGARRYLVISIAMVAGAIDVDETSGIVRSARIAVGACSAVAQRLPKLEARMLGKRLGAVLPAPDDLAHLSPIDDVRASGAYRRAAALQLVSDLVVATAGRSTAS